MKKLRACHSNFPDKYMIFRQLLKWFLPVLILFPGLSRAGPFTVYGYNPRAVAMGEAQSAAADDFSAVFYNPALMAHVENASIGFGTQMLRPSLWVDPGNNVFEGDNAPVMPENYTQWSVGTLVPFGGRFENYGAFGIIFSTPVGYMVTIESIDTARLQFPIYQSSARKMVIVPGIAIRPLPWISAGIGIQTFADVIGDVDLAVDLFTRRVRHRNMVIDFVARNGLVCGLVLGPVAGLKLGFSYRQEIGLDYIIPASIDMEDIGVLEVNLFGTSLWTPDELTWGISWDIPGIDMLLSFDITYGRWSKSPSPQAVAMVQTSGETLDGLGLGDAFDLCSDIEETSPDGKETVCRPFSPGYSDNLVPKFGIEKSLFGFLNLRAGYRFWPTPIPNQVGRTNYLDASSHHFSFGVGFIVNDPLKLFSRPFLVDAAFHSIRMRERHVEKGDNRDYSFGGSMFQSAFSLKYSF